MDRAQRSLSVKKTSSFNRAQLRNELVIKELSNETRQEYPVNHEMPTFHPAFSLNKKLEDISQAQHSQQLNTEQKFKKIKELSKENSNEINRMMEFLALQKTEYKKYKEKENRQIENVKKGEDHMLQKNMTDCYPKHPSVFQQRIHHQGMFEQTKFMPQECKAKKTKQSIETLRKDEHNKIMQKPWSYVAKEGNRLDLNKYDSNYYLLTRQTKVGIAPKEEEMKNNVHDQKWKYFYNHTKEYFEEPAPEYIDPKVKDFHQENNTWVSNSKHPQTFDPHIYK